MKLMLGNGWEQEVKTENGKEVIRYLKDGLEYTKEEYMNEKADRVNKHHDVLGAKGYKNLPNMIVENKIDVQEMAASLQISVVGFMNKLKRVEDEFTNEEKSELKGNFFPDLPVLFIFEVGEEKPITHVEVADTLGNALLEDGPFSLTTVDKNGEREDEVSREEFLEFYMNWASETLSEVTNEKKLNINESDTLREVTQEFDHNTGTLLVHLETLNNINSELGTISEDVRNTEFKDYAYLLNDIEHKIHLLADLLHYTLEDFSETYQKTRLIKESYFDLIVRGKGEKNE